MLYNHVDLQWQYDWAGASLINKRMLVCRPCLDTPQQQLRAIILPADPVPVINPRVEAYAFNETDNLVAPQPTIYAPTTGIPIPQGSLLTTTDGIFLTTQPVGPPLGLDPNAVMPLNGSAHFDILIPVMSVTSVGTNVITVTCSSPHNLATNDQISIFGTSNDEIMGFFSVKVLTATAFSYDIIPFISSGSFLTDTTRVATCKVGLPFEYIKIPIVQLRKSNGTNAPTAYIFVDDANQPIYFSNDEGDVLLWSFTP
jgi:hypothetical protein